jgi:archaellum component FlaC
MAARSSNNSSSTRRLEELERLRDAAKAAGQETTRFDNAINALNERLESTIRNSGDLDDELRSLGATIGKDSKLFQAFESNADAVRQTLSSVATVYKSIGNDSSLKKQVNNATSAYKKFNETFAESTKKLAKQQITTSQYNNSVIDAYESLEDFIDRIDKTTQAGQDLAKTLTDEKNRLEALSKAAERSKSSLEGMGFVLNNLSSTGIPAMEEFGNVITKAAEGGAGLTLGMAALGFAAGKAAYDLGLVGDKLGTIAKYDGQIAMAQASVDAKMKKFDLGMGGPGMDRNFVAEEAAMNFAVSANSARLEFEAASKTAFFGKGLGGVGYGAQQLQMAGISAETIATAMKDVSSVMGSNVSGEFGADIAILAARTGQTSEGIASINDTFMRLGGVSKETAINMQEGMRAMAEQANINLGALMEDVAAASKDALSYQLKSPLALQKAATFAQSLGTKFTDIANAGRSMVLNYKDSIKAEMSLSAMLGRRVDLSQVRALFAAGETEQALAALKAQGLDPSKMNAFQQEQLKSATGGLDLDSLQKIATRTGRTGELGKGNVGKENEIFLNAKQSAESAKMIGQEVASAMADLAKTEKLQGQREKQKQDNILANTFDIKKDMLDVVQLNKKKEIESSGVGYGLAGAGIATALTLLLTKGKGLGKLLGKGSNIFGKTPTTAPIPPSMSGSSISSGLKYNSSGRVINAQTGRFAPTGTANAFKSSQSLVQPAGTFAKPGMASSFTNTAKVGLGSKVTSNLASSVKGLGGVISVLGAAYDYKTRKDQGQSTLQAASGAGGGATGALAGAALGSAIVPVIGTIIGGAIGYWAGSSLADELTGANEPQVEAQENMAGTYEMSTAQLEKEIQNGNLLNSSEYAVELQQKMLELMGLQAEFLNDIAESNRSVTSVNLDGSKVLSLLNSRTAKNYGVTRLTSINRGVK